MREENVTVDISGSKTILAPGQIIGSWSNSRKLPLTAIVPSHVLCAQVAPSPICSFFVILLHQGLPLNRSTAVAEIGGSCKHRRQWHLRGE